MQVLGALAPATDVHPMYLAALAGTAGTGDEEGVLTRP
jgi:hypothetical protein